MGTLQEKLSEPDPAVVLASGPAAGPRPALPAKGSCWYCEKPLDAVKRFCGKSCHDAFDEEAELFNPNQP
ncbi:MAG: hypothetical protein ACXU8N_19980 [Telluria sp.]